MRLTVDEYSKHFKMSKEMIHSKLRAKKLNYIIEDAITYIIVPQSSLNQELRSEIHAKRDTLTKEKVVPNIAVITKPKTTVAMVLGLYQKENQQLKEKILQLETKIDKLIDDKEQMLRDEMAKIEQVYSSKDEQLKSILELVNAKLAAEESQTIHEIETIENKQEIIELKQFLNQVF